MRLTNAPGGFWEDRPAPERASGDFPELFVSHTNASGRSPEPSLWLTNASGRSPEPFVWLTNASCRSPEPFVWLTNASCRSPTLTGAATKTSGKSPDVWSAATKTSQKSPGAVCVVDKRLLQIPGAVRAADKRLVQIPGAVWVADKRRLQIPGAVCLLTNGSCGSPELFVGERPNGHAHRHDSCYDTRSRVPDDEIASRRQLGLPTIRHDERTSAGRRPGPVPQAVSPGASASRVRIAASRQAPSTVDATRAVVPASTPTRRRGEIRRTPLPGTTAAWRRSCCDGPTTRWSAMKSSPRWYRRTPTSVPSSASSTSNVSATARKARRRRCPRARRRSAATRPH